MQYTESLLPSLLKNSNIVVTGGTGSIGEKITSTLLKYQPNKVIVFSKDDTNQYLMKQKFAGIENLHFFLGDIRDNQAVEYVTQGADIIFHAAALKQVPVCENNPFEAIKTNIVGSENLIRASITNKVKKVINISTDKAVNPNNTMGATKFIAEKLFSQANFMINNQDTKFCSVRFGNVIGSRGSVLPILISEVKSGQPLTITEPEMTRFMMSIQDAVNLTLKAAAYSMGGEIFILKMHSLKIGNLRDAIEIYCQNKGLKMPPVKVIGFRPGEKLHEELLTSDEQTRVMENDELYVLLPKQKNHYLHFSPVSLPSYRSDQVDSISIDKILKFFDELDRN